MKIEGVEAALESGTLELETRDMVVVQRVITAMDAGKTVLMDTTEYWPVKIDVQSQRVVVPDTSSSAFSHKYEFRPVATITLRS